MKKYILYFSAIFILFINITQAQLKQNEILTGSIRGIVSSQMNQRLLSGITVKVLGTNRGAYSDQEGKFEIKNLPVGMYSVQFSGVGYETYVETDVAVTTGKSYYSEVQLLEKVIKLQGTEVRSSYFNKRVESATSTQTLSFEDIRRAPGVQEDVVRAASLLPGIAVAQAGRNDLVVRGGAPYENLFIVDNIEVPNINHFGSQGTSGGPVSIINLDYVKDVTFSSGAFGARYGDKVSSITNITLQNGNEIYFGYKANLSATGFGVNVEGPVSNNSSFFFSARRSYLDLIFKSVGFGFIPEYWDFLGKVNYKINQNNTLSFLAIGALGSVTLNNNSLDNRFQNSQFAVPNQNQYFSGITWKSLFSNGFLTMAFGRNYTYFNTYQNDSNLVEIFKNKSEESEIILKTDIDIQLNSTLYLVIGNQAKFSSRLRYNINIPGYLRNDNQGIFQPLLIDTSFTAFRNGTYTSLTTTIGQNKFTIGGRLDYYNFVEPKIYFSPRASFIFQLNDVSAFTLGAGRYYQSPSFIWLVGAPQQELKPIRSDQLVLGFDHTPLEDVKVQVEGYYKWYGNYPARLWRPQAVLTPNGFDDASTDIPFGLEPLISSGSGLSRGVEVFIQKKYSDIPIYGLMSFTLSESKFTSLDGIVRLGSFDSRYIINIFIGYMLNQKWEFSVKFRAATGLPSTPFLPDGKLDYTRYNEGERLPNYNALDLRVDKRWNFSGFSMVTYIDIQNVYGRKNVSGIRWNPRTQLPEYQTSFGVLPTIGLSVEF